MNKQLQQLKKLAKSDVYHPSEASSIPAIKILVTEIERLEKELEKANRMLQQHETT